MSTPEPPAEDPPAHRSEFAIAVEELDRARNALRQLENRYRALLDGFHEGVVVLDDRGRVADANAAARSLLGGDVGLREWLTGDQHAPAEGDPSGNLHPAMTTLIDGRLRSAIEVPYHDAAGAQKWLSVNARAVLAPGDARIEAVVCSFTDVTESRGARLELERHATVDALTGVFNRRYLDQRLHSEISRARRRREPLSLALGDIDHFKQVNDRYGHHAGDHALRRFAQALLSKLRSEDIVARVGGDEFCVVLPGTGASAAATALGRCLEMLNETDIAVDGAVFRLSGTFGVAELGADGGPKELMARADESLYRAKAAGRGRVLTA